VATPVLAAVRGRIVPALIYLAFNAGKSTADVPGLARDMGFHPGDVARSARATTSIAW